MRRRRRRRQERAGEGQYLEPVAEGYNPAGRGRLAEGDVGDGATTAEDGDAAAAAVGEGGDGVGDVGAGGDLEDVAVEGVGAVFGDDNGGLGLVFGARGASSWAALFFSIVFFGVVLAAWLRVSGWPNLMVLLLLVLRNFGMIEGWR